jgi:hypothetical protein
MNAGPPGAPERARTAHRAARYGIGWRARDVARSARHWLAHASTPEIMGTCWVYSGALLVTASIWSGPLEWITYAPGPVMCVLGAALRAVARARGWRR